MSDLMQMEFIKWIDPFVLDRPWNTAEEIEEKLGDMNCHTIGYIAKETDEFVVLAQGYSLKQDGEVEEWGHCWVLPKRCIVHRASIGLTRDSVAETLCGRCGKPAEGYATINGTRYCHGDEPNPTCYMEESWSQSQASSIP